MLVALRTGYGKAEDSFSEAIHAIDESFDPEFFCVDGALFIDHAIAQKTGGNLLLLCCIGQEVPGNLLGNKLVVG